MLLIELSSIAYVQLLF